MLYITLWDRQYIDIQLTYDSTYWNRTCVFGGYFIREQYTMGTGMEQMNWSNSIDYYKLGKDFKLPCWCPVCEDLDDWFWFFNTFRKNKDEWIRYQASISSLNHF